MRGADGGGMTGLGSQELLVILRRARALLSDPSHWTGRHYAENAEGRWIPVGSSQATRFNLEGALVHAAGRDAREALAAIFDVFGEASPEILARLRSTLAPSLTHSEALALLDAAIVHLSFVAERKQSGTRLRAITPDHAAPHGTKTRRD